MIENRRYTRTVLKHHPDVVDRLSNFAIGVIVDISKEGVRIASGKGFKRDMVLQLELPNPDKKNPQQLSFDARTCWCSKCDDGFFEAGFQIFNVSAEAQRILTSYS